MGAGHLADDEGMRDGRFPPLVHGESAVVVLCANGDLQRLAPEVDIVLGIDVDGQRIHVLKPVDGPLLRSAGEEEVHAGFELEVFEEPALDLPNT